MIACGVCWSSRSPSAIISGIASGGAGATAFNPINLRPRPLSNGHKNLQSLPRNQAALVLR